MLYRTQLLASRFAALATDLERRHAALPADDDADGRGGSAIVDPDAIDRFVQEQIEYLERTRSELARPAAGAV